MTQNPFINALAALLYIAVIASGMYWGPRVEGQGGVIVPITFLSLFVLSAAMMGYLFFYQPAQLFLGGKQKEGATLFLKTLLLFAGIVIILLASLFFLASS